MNTKALKHIFLLFNFVLIQNIFSAKVVLSQEVISELKPGESIIFDLDKNSRLNLPDGERYFELNTNVTEFEYKDIIVSTGVNGSLNGAHFSSDVTVFYNRIEEPSQQACVDVVSFFLRDIGAFHENQVRFLTTTIPAERYVIATQHILSGGNELVKSIELDNKNFTEAIYYVKDLKPFYMK